MARQLICKSYLQLQSNYTYLPGSIHGKTNPHTRYVCSKACDAYVELGNVAWSYIVSRHNTASEHLGKNKVDCPNVSQCHRHLRLARRFLWC